MKRILIVTLLLLMASSVFAQGELQQSEKLTLFIFPVRYESRVDDFKAEDRAWAREQFFETFVTTFERFDFVELKGEANIDSFLANADQYMAEHAREFVQKRKEPNGRIGEVMVTLDDLIAAIENGFAFVPVFDEVKIVEKKDEEPQYFVDFHIDIWRTSTKEKIGTVNASSEGIGAILGAFKQMATGQMGTVSGKDDEEKRLRQDLHSKVDGIYEDLKTQISGMWEFSLKAVAYDTGLNGYSIDLGKDFGVRHGKQYKTWSLNDEGKPYKMGSWGKVRRVEEASSRIQVLIGRPGPGDQVIEYPKAGLNIGVLGGIVPFRLKGFDNIGTAINLLDPNLIFTLPEDSDADRLMLGLNAEYDIAWITSVNELYIVLEGGWIPVNGLWVYEGMGGVRKKFLFRRLGVWGTVKFGGIGINFIDTDIFDDEDVEEGDDATVIGVGVDVGGEFWITPDWRMTGQIGFAGFPEQIVLIAADPSDGWKLKNARIASAGVTFSFGVSRTF